MSKLTELALAGFQLEKSAGLGDLAERGIRALPGLAAAGVVGGLAGHITSKDSKGVKPGQESMARKTGRAASTVAGAATGGLAGTLAGIQGTRLGMVAGKGKVQTAMAVGGGLAGAIGGGLLGHKAVREKKASLVDVAKGIASVGKNLVKQNPTAAKAALGGAVAGAVATKALQTKQASEKKSYGALRHVRDAALTAVDAYAGKAVGGVIAATTSKHQIPGGLHMQRVGFGKGLGMAAGAAIGVANSLGRREAHEKYAAAADKALQKEEKANGGPVNVSGGGTAPKAKSSLVASAKAEMAKAASKK